MFSHGADLPRGAARRYDHVIRDGGFAGEVDHDDVFGLVVVERLDGELAELLGKLLREMVGKLPGELSRFGSVLGLRSYGCYLC
jgi:hypothetical protein